MAASAPEHPLLTPPPHPPSSHTLLHPTLVKQDFQFFNIPRLTELYEKDNSFEVHKHALAQVTLLIALLVACYLIVSWDV